MNSSVLSWFGVAICGAVGAVSRYAVETHLAHPASAKSWFTSTLIVNTLGSAFAAAVTVLAGAHLPLAWRAPLLAGFAGGFTTFSRMSLEAHLLFTSGRPLLGAAYLILGPVAGLCAVAITIWLLTVILSGMGNQLQ
jgi:CrcB protein